MKALLDGDVIVYQAGFASDQTAYHVDDEVFQYKREAVSHCKEHGIALDEIVKEVTPEPIEFCLASVKKMIHNIVESCGADDYKVYLTGKGNFRDELVGDYKANRDSSHKPIHYQEIRDYLEHVHDALVVQGIEADDALGIEQTHATSVGEETVICTIDKDLRMIPGLNYNWRIDVLSDISKSEADNFFWMQMLTGDKADNIHGIHGVGDVTATKLLVNCDTNEDYFAKVKEVWKERTELNDEEIDSTLDINGQLLWIYRDGGSDWKTELSLET